MEYKVTIGLEVHAELKTKTKLFCNSANDPNEKRPNWNICPVCMGHPGILPVLNKEAVKHILRIGVAVGGELVDYTEFDRKNYFYPDIPKGYQISQYAYPLVRGGTLAGVSLTRIHLEEDTARSTHDQEGASLIDFNRAGVPLMELVTEPVIHSAEEAGHFARELQLLLRYLDVGEANMEKGEMRVEANISISTNNDLGTKVEIKNLNSFRSVERGIRYEIKRHEEILRSGKKVLQETRGWDEGKQETFSQRVKEDSHDYRYFPDPDIPKLKLSEITGFSTQTLVDSMPELPWDRRERYRKDFNIKDEDIDMYIQNPFYSNFFEEVSRELDSDIDKIKIASNYITSDLAGFYKGKDIPNSLLITAKSFADLVEMISNGNLSSRGAKDILVILLEKGGKPQELAEELGLLQRNDEAYLIAIVQGIIKDNPSVVKDYKSGKESSLQFLVGQGMKETKGSANPRLLRKLLEERLV